MNKFIYRGLPELIHIPDGKRAHIGEHMAAYLSHVMRTVAESRTERQRFEQRLCPGCYMVVVFNMAVSLAKDSGQSLPELGATMAKAFQDLARGGEERIEEVEVQLEEAGDVCLR